jgi:hypothetical protein
MKLSLKRPVTVTVTVPVPVPVPVPATQACQPRR